VDKTPTSSTELDWTTVPTLPVADTPVMATVISTATDPTAPVASTPVRAKALATSTVPTAPVATTPVRATTTVFSPNHANGACAYAEIPNMVYGLRRLRLGCCQTQ